MLLNVVFGREMWFTVIAMVVELYSSHVIRYMTVLMSVKEVLYNSVAIQDVYTCASLV